MRQCRLLKLMSCQILPPTMVMVIGTLVSLYNVGIISCYSQLAFRVFMFQCIPMSSFEDLSDLLDNINKHYRRVSVTLSTFTIYSGLRNTNKYNLLQFFRSTRHTLPH